MIESITVATLCILFLIFFRPGKTPPLENQLVIERPGKYRMVLAPKLNLAQPFIEKIVNRIETLECANREGTAKRFFSIKDKSVTASGKDVYLLAVIYRSGILHFQAEWPLSNNPSNYLDTIKALALDSLKDTSATAHQSETLKVFIGDAVQDIADERGIAVTVLDRH